MQKGLRLVATNKTTPVPATSGRKTPQPKAKTVEASEPVVLEPPKKPETAAKVSVEQDVPVTKPAESDAETDPATEAAKSVAQPAEPLTSKPRRPIVSFVLLLAGGAIVAALGYYAAIQTAPRLPDYNAQIQHMQASYDARIAELEQKTATLTTQIKTSSAKDPTADLEALKDAIAKNLENLTDRLGLTETQLQNAVAELEAIKSKLTDNLEITGGNLDDAAMNLITRYGSEIDALKARIDEQVRANADLAKKLQQVANTASTQLIEARDKAASLANSAVNTVKNADISVAMTRLQAAVDTGKAYTDLLVQIAKDAAVDIPDALLNPSHDGVSPLLKLQQDFPEAARKGLKASIKASAGDGISSKFVAFVQAQVGARSLEEKPGDDPDAILSRAQGALNRGELAAAVGLVRQLPVEGINAMSDWLAPAEMRLEAYKALEAFSHSMQLKN